MRSEPASRAAVFRAGVAGVAEVPDFDAIREVSPEWDQLHLQVGRGQARARTVLAQTSQMQVAVVSRSPGARIQGTPPRGCAVLALALQGPRLQVQGLPWTRGKVAFVRAGGEFDLMAPAPHAELVVAVSQSLLDEVALARWGQVFPGSPSGPCLDVRNEASRRAVLATCARWLRTGIRDPGTLNDAATAALMEREVLETLLDAVQSRPVEPALRPRQELVRRADAFLRRSLQEHVSLGDLCAAVGASARAVHAAFQDVYGVPPKAYWKALRLSAARAELRQAPPGVTVSEVAARWGFFQFGYFSVDYRRMFGESPRDTLRTARMTRPARTPRGDDERSVA